MSYFPEKKIKYPVSGIANAIATTEPNSRTSISCHKDLFKRINRHELDNSDPYFLQSIPSANTPQSFARRKLGGDEGNTKDDLNFTDGKCHSASFKFTLTGAALAFRANLCRLAYFNDRRWEADKEKCHLTQEPSFVGSRNSFHKVFPRGLSTRSFYKVFLCKCTHMWIPATIN